MERSSTAMQITGIGNSSLGLIIAFFSHTSNFALGVALKKEIRKFFFSSLGYRKGQVVLHQSHSVKPQKNNLRRCGEGSEGCVTLHTSKGGSSKGCRLICFFMVWCVISVLPVLAAWGGFVQIPLRWVPSTGWDPNRADWRNLCVGNTCTT